MVYWIVCFSSEFSNGGGELLRNYDSGGMLLVMSVKSGLFGIVKWVLSVDKFSRGFIGYSEVMLNLVVFDGVLVKIFVCVVVKGGICVNLVVSVVGVCWIFWWIVVKLFLILLVNLFCNSEVLVSLVVVYFLVVFVNVCINCLWNIVSCVLRVW